MNSTEIILLILSALVGVPILGFLLYKLGKAVVALFKAKKYPELFKLLISNMELAATNCETDKEKKDLVMELLDMNATELGIALSEEEKDRIADCIDAICALAKVLRRGKEN